MPRNDPILITESVCTAHRATTNAEIRRLDGKIDDNTRALQAFKNDYKEAHKELIEDFNAVLQKDREQARLDRASQFSNLKYYVAGAVAMSAVFMFIIDYVIRIAWGA